MGFNKCTKNRPEVANLESRPFDALLWEELCKIVGGIVFPLNVIYTIAKKVLYIWCCCRPINYKHEIVWNTEIITLCFAASKSQAVDCLVRNGKISSYNRGEKRSKSFELAPIGESKTENHLTGSAANKDSENKRQFGRRLKKRKVCCSVDK